MLRFQLLFALAVCLAAQDTNFLRLPSDVRPVRYRATLGISPGSDTFSGSIDISLQVDKPTAEITLHAKELDLQAVSPTPREIRKGANDLVTLVYDSPIPAGPAALHIQYSGTISRVLTDGAFQQKHSGDWYVFTKFEPITARRVFPCFDEPGFKVPWQLSLRVPQELKAFSNTPEVGEDAGADGSKLVRFKETKPLPSYLLAFAVGPFDVVETAPVGSKHVPSRIVVPKGRAAEAQYAASITPGVVEMLEGYFGSPYPYEKLDQIVVPLTTAWGAMENAGLIAYGDFFLAPKAQDSEFRHEQLSITVAHEMSHQWFGDLVTLQWWNDLWLNEAFASWVSNKLVAKWHPEWRIDEKRASATAVFRADSLTTSRKIRQPIEAAGDIGGAFDGITYGKGQDVIAMFEHYLGEAVFKKGVHEYLKAHEFGNATSDDLLSALDQAAPGNSVVEAFGTFLNQVGFPMLGLSVDCSGTPAVRLTQRRMVPRGSSAKENAIWDVPVCLEWDGGSKCVLLKKQVETFQLDSKTCPTGVFADAGAAGYYATNYTADNKIRLEDPAEKAAFARNNRLLFASGLGDMDVELRASAETKEHDPLLEQQAAAMLESVSDWVDPALRSAYAARIRELYGARARELGWRPKGSDSSEIRALRREVVSLVATEGEDSVLASEARQLTDAWLKDRGTLEAEVVASVLRAAAWHGSRDLFDAMVAALSETQVQRERNWIITGLSGFRDPAIYESALQLIGAAGIDARETSALLFNFNAEGREVVWKYVQANFDKLNQMLPSARGVPFATRLPEVAEGFCDVSHAQEVETFFHDRLEKAPGGPRSLARTLESIRLCAAEAEGTTQAVSRFLRP